MGFQYRKSKTLGKNTKLNVSSKSIGISTGVKGAKVSMNSRGRSSINLSIPGTGLRYRKTFSAKNGGGIIGLMLMCTMGFLNFTIYLCKVSFILCWWALKALFYFTYYFFYYAYLACRWIANKIISLISNWRSKKRNHSDTAQNDNNEIIES